MTITVQLCTIPEDLIVWFERGDMTYFYDVNNHWMVPLVLVSIIQQYNDSKH